MRIEWRLYEQIFQALAPSLPSPKLKASDALLAHIFISWFQDHKPYVSVS
jgi:hypothetical protein